jgi:hypothetical protein
MKLFLAMAAAIFSIQAANILPNQTMLYDSATGGHTSTVLQVDNGGTVTVGAFTLPVGCTSAVLFCTYNPSFSVGVVSLTALDGTVGVHPDGTFRPSYGFVPFLATETSIGSAAAFGRFGIEMIIQPGGRVQATFVSQPTTETPEPATWAMLAGAAIAATIARQRRR